MYLYVKVHPHSKKESLTWKSENKLDVFCKEKAEANKANIATKRILSEELNLPESHIRQISGRQKPHKIFEVKKIAT